MNLYDKEINIIKFFQEIEVKKIHFCQFNFGTVKIFNSIYFKKKWQKWTDTSLKKLPPPDFYNNKLKLMMDVMRIDDHSYVDKDGRSVNLHNKRESELIKELISKNESIRDVLENGRLYITPRHEKFGEEDHNYNLYIKNFERVITNHINKIENYKKNHPNFKVIFLIFDESTPYMKRLSKNEPKVPGDLIYGKLHLWWNDYNMLKIINNSKIDYVIWMSPYKIFQTTRKVKIPVINIIDVKKINIENTIKYDAKDMQSTEL